MDWTKAKRAARFIAYATLFLTFFTYAETFYRAYFFGGDAYEAIVHINDYGEAWWEVIWITLAIPCVLFLFLEKLWEMDVVRKLRER